MTTFFVGFIVGFGFALVAVALGIVYQSVYKIVKLQYKEAERDA